MSGLHIRLRIWLSINIFVSGLLMSTVAGYFGMLRNERDLSSISDRLVPAAQHGHDAQSAFTRLIQGYSDSFPLQEPLGMQRAAAEAAGVLSHLHAIARAPGISASRASAAGQLATDLQPFLGEGGATYPRVWCHLADLNQVFLNLLVNAAHAIGDVVKGGGGRGEIRVGTRREKAHVSVSISDSSCGIPKEIQSRVFDPFITTKEVGKGTGQGLAIARNIVVDEHGGKITFVPNLPRGTTFVVSRPVVETPDTNIQPAEPVLEGGLS